MRRQVVDIKIQRVITEYRAEILEDQNGNQTVQCFLPLILIDVSSTCAKKAVNK
jgi:hypothetical protein